MSHEHANDCEQRGEPLTPHDELARRLGAVTAERI